MLNTIVVSNNVWLSTPMTERLDIHDLSRSIPLDYIVVSLHFLSSLLMSLLLVQ